MSAWLCARCAVEFPVSSAPPEGCSICNDEREAVEPPGQRWTTLAELEQAGRRGQLTEVEPGLVGIAIEPAVGIGQRALLARTDAGNLLWDPTGYVDDDLVAAVTAHGGVAAIAASHPHMFGAQVAWSHRFGGVPVYVNRADRDWVQRDDRVLRDWDEQAEVLPGIVLHRIGGHFPGSAVVRLVGRDQGVVLLTGDTVLVTADRRHVSFMRSFPNLLPMSADVVAEIADRLVGLAPDRLYDNFGGTVGPAAAEVVKRSADRYIAWIRGDHDGRTRAGGI